MNKELCLIHANCQGEPLAELLSMHKEFAARYEIKAFVNYTQDHVPPADLARCSLLLYQWLGSRWGDLSSKAMLSRLGPLARSVCIPNLFFKSYWPLWDSNKGIDYSDRLLNEFIGRGLTKAEILHLYLHTDIKKYYDLDRLVEESLEREREKERRADIKTLDLVLEGYRNRRLFSTVNHPGRELCLHVANGVLERLGFTPLDDSTASRFSDPFPEFVQPIHPQIVDYLGLGFVEPDRKYFVYGSYKTFEEYTACYVDCRMLGVEDFIGYLRLDCGRRQTPWQPEE